MDFYKQDNDPAFWSTYTNTMRTFVYSSSDSTWTDVAMSEVAEFTLEEPDYAKIFTSEAEQDAQFEEEIMNESRDFDLSEFDPTATGTAFQVFSGGFVFYPNFKTSAFQFKWVLEMPEDAFLDSEGKWLYQWATYMPVGGTADMTTTVACFQEISEENFDLTVYQYDGTFDSTADQTLPLWEQNYAANVDSDFYPNFKDNIQRLKPSIGGKMKAGCIAQAEIPPEEAADLFGIDYAVTVGGRMYDSYDSATFAELPAQDYVFTIEDLTPAEGFEVETDARAVQIVEEKSYAYSADEILDGVSGEITQRVFTGFSVNPYSETSNTHLEIYYEIEGPQEGWLNGARIYQWMTFLKADDYESDPMTVACVAKVGNPFDSEVRTFQGSKTMENESDVVVGRVWSEQNVENVAKADDSFQLSKSVADYTMFDSGDDYKVQPCMAFLDFGAQILDSTNEIYGTYNVTIGARFYEDEESTDFAPLPSQFQQMELTAPESDLESVFSVTGDDAADDVSEEVVYLTQKKKFQVDNVFTGGENFGGKGWMHIEGGYKLYKNADSQWYYRLAAELPANVFENDAQLGKIFYFWVKYTPVEAGYEDLVGAAACKVVIGDPTLSEAFQWDSDVNMNSDSDGIAGKRWYRQNTNSQMTNVDYFISLWNPDLYDLQDSPRTTGNYKIQGCDISIDLSEEELNTVSFTMQGGLRIYDSDDATEFYTTPEPPFNYYQKELEYTDELEEVPVYAPEKQKAEPKEEKVHTLDIAAITEAFGTDKINEWEAAYMAA